MHDAVRHLRKGCGLIRPSFRSLYRLIGADRISFLQGMLSNDIARLSPGQGVHATHLTQQGRLVSDLRVYVLEQEVWLDVPSTRFVALRESLERFLIADDVEFIEPPLYEPLVALEGPEAPAIAAQLFSDGAPPLPLHSHRRSRFEGAEVHLVAASHTGEHGLLCFGEPSLAARLWSTCESLGALAIDETSLDTLRIEAGIPIYGRDMDESNLVSEVGFDDAISFKKGCYLGQEVVERIAARGQVQKKLVGVLFEGDPAPAASPLRLGDGSEVGRITSATYSPTRNAGIALAYVRRDHWNPGTELLLSDGRAARVSELPFVPCPGFSA